MTILEAKDAYDLDKLETSLTKAGFRVDCSALRGALVSWQAGLDVALAGIAQQAATAAKHASAALEALLALDPANPVAAILASAAQAAAAASVKLLGGEDHSDEEEEEDDGEEAHACHGNAECSAQCEHMHEPEIWSKAVLSCTGRISVRGGSTAAMACDWRLSQNSDTVQLTPAGTGAGAGAPCLFLECLPGQEETAAAGLRAVLTAAATGAGHCPCDACTDGREHECKAKEGGGATPATTEATPAPASAVASQADTRPPPPAFALAWREITCGAPELQGVLDSLPEGALAVLSWHAEWVPACAAAEAALAARPLAGVAALLRLRVEGTPANRALALKRVAALPQARRKGAKLVLRSGAHFPALCLLAAPSMQHISLAEGPEALRELAVAASQAGAARLAGLVAAARAEGVPAISTPTLHPLDPKTAAPQLLALIKAADDRPLLVLWSEGPPAKGLVAELQSRVQGTVRVALADISQAAVQKLAASLGLRRFPALLSFAGGKEALRRQGEELTLDALLHAVAAALLRGPGDSAAVTQGRPGAGTAAAKDTPLPGMQRLSIGEPAQSGEESTSAESLGPAAATQPPSLAEASLDSQPRVPSPDSGAHEETTSSRLPAAVPTSVFDPPDAKLAKPGFTKRLEDGYTVHYFPKMPCLRCGCPWWTSDEWDAKCLRCQWDCESTGYDDDSRPLPKYQKKWEGFVAQINAGKTAAWGGKK